MNFNIEYIIKYLMDTAYEHLINSAIKLLVGLKNYLNLQM